MANNSLRTADASARIAHRLILRCASLFLIAGVFTTEIHANEFPGAQWDRADPEAVGVNKLELAKAHDYAITGGGSGMVIRHAKVVLAWGDTKKLYDLKSTTKSIGVTSLGLAIADAKIDLNEKVRTYYSKFAALPASIKDSEWSQEVTIKHLATQTAGFDKSGGYQKLLFKPGSHWHYSDCGPNWLAECITLVYERDVQELLFDRVLTPIGVERSDLRWRKHAYRPIEILGIPRREFGSGVHANVNAMARIGLLYLRRGRWKSRQLIPDDFVDAVRNPFNLKVDIPKWKSKKSNDLQWSNEYGDASAHYGLLWWNNADGSLKSVPQDAYWSWGLHDSLIVVIPSLDIVAVRAGKSWKRHLKAKHYDVLHPFIGPIAASAEGG